MPLDRRQFDGKYWSLFQIAQRLAWTPAHVDLGRDAADWARIRREHPAEDHAGQLHRLLGFFHAGEESVAANLAPMLVAIARLRLGVDKECHLAAQLLEEAKHFEFFERYAREVLREDGATLAAELQPAPQAVLVDDLAATTDRLARETDADALRAGLVEAATHYMGIVEAMLARTGYAGALRALEMRDWLPGLQAGFRLIRRDEGRHVTFGFMLVRELVAADPSLAPVVFRTFERHLPNVLATVQAFDVPHPLVDVDRLVRHALDAHAMFLAAAGLGTGDARALLAEVVES